MQFVPGSSFLRRPLNEEAGDEAKLICKVVILLLGEMYLIICQFYKVAACS